MVSISIPPRVGSEPLWVLKIPAVMVIPSIASALRRLVVMDPGSIRVVPVSPIISTLLMDAEAVPCLYRETLVSL